MQLWLFAMPFSSHIFRWSNTPQNDLDNNAPVISIRISDYSFTLSSPIVTNIPRQFHFPTLTQGRTQVKIIYVNCVGEQYSNPVHSKLQANVNKKKEKRNGVGWLAYH
jgi:hypothetical protein